MSQTSTPNAPEIYYRMQSGIPTAIDITYDGQHGRWSGKTFEALSSAYPGLVRSSVDAYENLRLDALRVPVMEIGCDRFHEMLGAMPPLDYVIDSSGTSFKSEERYSGSITSIFACSGERYFELRDLDSLSHTEIIGRVADFIESEHDPLPAPRA